ANQTEYGVLMGFEDILKSTGSESFILYVLYGILFILSVVVFMLLRKLITAYRTPKKMRKKSINPLHPDKAHVRKAIKENKVLEQERKLQEIRSFAGKLSEIYARTDANGVKTETAPISRKQAHVPRMSEHTKRIEEIFAEKRDSMPFDSEAVRLIRQYKNNNVESKSSPDKYEVVRQLAAQNWEIWEIARELSMGTEEVKMAMSQGELTEDTLDDEFKYEKIYQLSAANLSHEEIAKKLRLDEEQVRLALKLKDRQKAAV
ncbi:hypothetical protein ACFL5L_06590, partial [candidate division KSB1 bacterium]